MNASNHPAASDLSIEQLVVHALSELKKLSCSRRTLRRYRTVWQHLAALGANPGRRTSPYASESTILHGTIDVGSTLNTVHSR